MKYWMRLAVVALTTLSLGVLLVAALLLPTYFTVREQRIALEANQEYVELARSTRRADSSIKELTELKKLFDTLALQNSGNSVPKAIARAIELAPKGLSITQFVFSGNSGREEQSTLLLSGVAPDRETLGSFSRALLNVPGAEKVDLPVSNLASDRDIEYSLTLFGSW